MEDLSRAIESAEGAFPDDFYASVKVEVMKAFGLLLGKMPDRFDLLIGSKSLFHKSRSALSFRQYRAKSRLSTVPFRV